MAQTPRSSGPRNGWDVRALPPPPLARPNPRIRHLQRRGVSISLLVAALLLVALLQGFQTISRFALASPIYFEEDLSGCAAGASLTTIGWTHSTVGTGTFLCDDDEFFPDQSGYPGQQSFNHSLTGTLNDGWLSPTFSISGANTLSLGFAVRFASFGTPGSGGWNFRGLDGIGPSVPVVGFDVNDTGRVSILHSTGFVFISFTVVLDTWYVVRFEVVRSALRYDTFINGTLEDDDASILPGPTEIDRLFLSGSGAIDTFTDWIFTDQLTLEPIPDAGVFTSTNVSIAAVADASTDVIWDLSVSPSFLSVNVQTGLISGVPTAAGTFPVTVTGNVSTGQDSESFVLTVVERGFASFGYSGITAANPCGATYFNSFTGRVRPVPCSDVLLSLDMETLDASGELHDFALDQTGTLNHTATRTGLSPIETTFGAGQDFNGSGPQNMTLNGDLSEIGRPESWTAHWWLLLNDDSDNRTLWTKWADVDGAGGWYFEVTGGDQFLVSWGGTDNHTFAFVLPKGAIFPLTVTFDFHTGNLTLYSNRTFRDSATFLAHGASEAAGVVPIIGEAQNASYNYNGTLDEFILWQRRALTLDQVVGLQTPFPAPVPLVRALPPAGEVPVMDALLPGILTVAAIVGVTALLGFITWKFATRGIERMHELAAKVKK